MFRSTFSEDIFNQRYSQPGAETWPQLADVLVKRVLSHSPVPIPSDDIDQLVQYVTDMKFIPGGRYLYYANRERFFVNNCFLMRSEEDTREDWAKLSWQAEMALMTGGGIGNDYTRYRHEGAVIQKTGGHASGPIPKMMMLNEIGRHVMQGGSRRSALYASLAHYHPDAEKFLYAKDWKKIPVGSTGKSVWDIKVEDFNFQAPLDMTNISINYDTDWLNKYRATGDPGDLFKQNVRQALETAEPGFSFNFFENENETLRNACTEVTSEDDSDVCNIGSLNFSRITSKEELADVTRLAILFLLCGSIGGDLPYDKVETVRAKNRRLGLGVMGMHEWLLQRNSGYEMTDELREWMEIYQMDSDKASQEYATAMSISIPVKNRAIAPNGTTGILAGTTGGIEPIYAVAYQRRYLKGKTDWHYQYVVDSAAKYLIDTYGLDPDKIQSALTLAETPEKRIKFQADVQDYVDMGISSTINLPAWGSDTNNEDTVDTFATNIAKYAHRLRGITCYPDGARGGQPLTPVSYHVAKNQTGIEFEEASHDICDISGKGGVCGV